MEWISGNVFIRPLGDNEGLAPGKVVDGHTHNFDHTTIFFNGRWKITKRRPATAVDGTEVMMVVADIERQAPFHLLIEAGAHHEITYLGDDPIGRAWCVYSHRTPQGEVSVENTGWRVAYS